MDYGVAAMELQQWSCGNGVAAMELRQWSCGNGVAVMELRQLDTRPELKLECRTFHSFFEQQTAAKRGIEGLS